MKMDRICGFNIGKASNFKFVEGSGRPGTKMSHYESINLKGYSVEIYPPNTESNRPVKYIRKNDATQMFRVEGNRISRVDNSGVRLLQRTPVTIIEKAEEFINTAPESLKAVLKIEKFKWVKL